MLILINELMILLEKKQLRQDITQKIKAFLAKDSANFKILADFKKNILPFIKTTSKVGIYYPLKSEFNILPIAEELSKNHISLLLPVIIPSNEIAFYSWDLEQNLENSFVFKNILEPSTINSFAEIPNFIITPLIACDYSGNRLGRGKGYYDKYLNKHKPNVISIGICYDFQLIDKIPVEQHDQKLDIILTDKHLINNSNL